jgi:hypothetical protein
MKNLDTFHVDRLASPLTLRVENLQLSSDHPGVHRGTTSEVSTLETVSRKQRRAEIYKP